MTPAEIQKMIEAGLPNAMVRVESADDTHFQAIVVSDSFTGQRSLARHQLVYRCLGDRMGNEIHALSIRAYTGLEWARLGTTGDGTD